MNPTALKTLLTLALVMAAATTGARAEAERLVIATSGPMGTFAGRQYTWAQGELQGTVTRADGTRGRYSVPVSLAYPDRNANGFGFVDVVNNADFTNFTDETAPRGRRSVLYSGNVIFSDFLRTEGYTYISVQWSRTVTDSLGSSYGSIENGIDGYEIMRDAARFLRSPNGIDGGSQLTPSPVQWVIAHGYSSSANVLRGFVLEGQNREKDGSLVFDGFLPIGNSDSSCRVLTNDETPRSPPNPTVPTFYANARCVDPLPPDGRIISIRTQSDVANGLPTRHELPSYRVYEVAGVSHIPDFINHLRDLGATRQNPVSWRPVAKAMLRHLAAWIATGVEPPPTLYLEGEAGPDGTFIPRVDQDGNVLGGIRLPHMASILPDSRPAGAPLGVYGARDPDLNQPRFGYADGGGTFSPFSHAELMRRYPTREAYVELVRRSADALLAAGYILAEDRDRYVRSAQLEVW